MSRFPTSGLFVTGTDTGVGKTYCAALLARALRREGHRVGVYKPVASGCRWEGDEWICDDARTLWEAAGCPGTLSEVCPQQFAAPLAPHLAARAEGREVDVSLLLAGLEIWRDACDVVLVEGAGGLMSPVSDDRYVADLADAFGYPLLVVAPNQLGVLNQTLQTLIVAHTFRAGLDVAGIVLNDVAAHVEDVSVMSNRSELEQRSRVPVLAHVAWQADAITSDADWLELMRRS
jgi:dethiobiotin synthetase